MIFIAYYLSWQKRQPDYPPKIYAARFVSAQPWRALSLSIMLATPVLAVFINAQLTLTAAQGVLTVGISLLAALISTNAYLRWRRCDYLTEQGVWGHTALSMPRYMAWEAVTQVNDSRWQQHCILRSTSQSVYLSRHVERWDELAYAVWQTVPRERIHSSLNPPAISQQHSDQAEGDMELRNNLLAWQQRAPSLAKFGLIAWLATLVLSLISGYTPALGGLIAASLMALSFAAASILLALKPMISSKVLHNTHWLGTIMGSVLISILLQENWQDYTNFPDDLNIMFNLLLMTCCAIFVPSALITFIKNHRQQWSSS